MIIGVDIGGTKVAAGLVDAAGNITRKTRVAMSGFSSVHEAIAPLISSDVTGIGLCSPGPLDYRTGVVINPPNLPYWRDFPLVEETTHAFGVPARLDNDANAAALAEVLWGAGKGHRHVFYATLGTGVGSGFVIDGRIFHGRTGNAAEGGHVTIDYRGPVCGCGKPGCIEALASGPAIARRAGMARAEDVGAAYRAGDAKARAVLAETAELLAVWLGNVVDLLDPDVIVVGGGVAELMAPFFDDLRAALPRWAINPHAREIPMVPARYGADSGIAGAASLITTSSE
ncbi:MAG TPA: ROK family protein [Candidatus Solibacter sp.]|nr:ROK family protein [Candidatus Solibacter sp.]